MKNNKNTINYLSQVTLGEGEFSDVEVLRVGTIQDRDLKITKKMLTDFVDNFKKNTYGTELQVNLEHRRGSEAAGWVKDLFITGQKLFAKVEWTILGTEKIEKKLFKFVSAEFAMDFPHHKTGEMVRNVFIGLALTNTPALKSQNALTLSEELNYLLIENNMFKTFLKSLLGRDVVSKEDKTLMNTMLEEATDEAKEETKEDVAAVEAKPEEVETPEPTEGDDDKGGEEETPEGGEAESLTEKQLTESLKERDARIAKLEENQARTDLSEVFMNDMTIKKGKTVGFLEASKSKAIDFMFTLSQGQRTKFNELLSEIRSVELGEIGSSKAESQVGTLADKIVSRTTEILSENPKMNIIDAQKKATKELDLA